MEQAIQTSSRGQPPLIKKLAFTLPCVASFIRSKLPKSITFKNTIQKGNPDERSSDSEESSSNDNESDTSDDTAKFTKGLPRNYADKVLELEMRIQYDFMDSKAVEDLINLYSVIIDIKD